MTAPQGMFTPYSTIKPFLGGPPQWMPPEAADRIASYAKYDAIYWNDETQFQLRVLEGEYPIYIPNARTIVDTTSHYLLKGLTIAVKDAQAGDLTQKALTAFLGRELFYSRFHTAKHAGVARGDFVLHMTANPQKAAGARISLNSIDPSMVFPIYDDDDLEKLLRVHIVDIYQDTDDSTQQRLRKLTYEYVEVGRERRVKRSEGIYKLDEKWYGQKPTLLKETIPEGLLPPAITTIPIYWFKNIDWQGQEFGSSELRGFERLLHGVSQAATDQEIALALEGLGVYATDGGRPVNDKGEEVDWEVAPGKVMEVPSGSYFRRVEGLSSMKPSMDHINYVESKLREAGGLSDVALGRVDVQTAQSGIALAIKFMPTLAKIEERDTAGVGRLKQLFYDWKAWHALFEGEVLVGDIDAMIGDKLPGNRMETINELNNMLDRGVISRKYYRDKMTALGYEFPDGIENDIASEKEKDSELAAKAAGALAGSTTPPEEELPPEPGKGGSGTLPARPNQSNNRSKPNESAGTESGQSPQRQARGGKP